MSRHRRDPAPVERIVPGLDRIRAALALTGNPERAFRAIHVAGTNGKGSASVVAASILGRLLGGGVGLYTSPHLLSPSERIRIGGEPIPVPELESLSSRAAALSASVESGTGAPLSWFETMTWAAFSWFGQNGVRLAVLETGLGGRWDATNVCLPSVCAVTSIGIDHVDWLGSTLRAIAAEKAGILKPGVPVVLGRLGAVPRSVIRSKARELGAPVWELGRDFYWEAGRAGTVRFMLPGVEIGGVRLKLKGTFQNDNAAVGCAAAWRHASGEGIPTGVFSTAAREGLSSARWPGRLSALPGRGNRGAWADGAHNPAAARTLALEIVRGEAFGGRKPVVAIWSMLADKNIAGFVRALSPAIDRWVAYPLRHERAASVEMLAAASKKAGVDLSVAPDFGSAWRCARAAAGPGGAVIVCGSLVAVADAYSERVGHI
jgi:dihydrofolate synthase/folylpolyglutamate synthase